MDERMDCVKTEGHDPFRSALSTTHVHTRTPADLAFYRREGTLSQQQQQQQQPAAAQGGVGVSVSASGGISAGGSIAGSSVGASLWGQQQLQAERQRRREVALELEAGVKELEVRGSESCLCLFCCFVLLFLL
jgi:hypothetical protein